MTNTNQLNTEVNEIAVVDEQVNKNDIVTVDKVTPNIFAAEQFKRSILLIYPSNQISG
ncbi:hypothetical protein ACJTC3_26410 [Bacillus cereus]|uniref:hypothetical protein n=1 Tax=Bacillus cereus TaxID=1396 RepID=UPI00396E324F